MTRHGRGRRGRALLAVVALVLGTTVLVGPASATTARLAGDNPCRAPGSHGFQASFVTPYWFFDKTQAQVDALFRAQRAAGSDQIILQWSSHAPARVAAYPGSAAYAHFNDAVPTVLRAGRAHDMRVWVGLTAAPGVLDTADRIDDPAVLRDLEEQTLRSADELWRAYGDDIGGWYLPIEPNEYSVATDEARRLQVDWIERIVTRLHQRYPGVPVMGSPSMPRATLVGMSSTTFMERFEPFITDTGVDVWNVQDGFKMTAWGVEQEIAAFRLAQGYAAGGAEIWASMYTPGPGEENHPTDPDHLAEYARALGAAGIPLTDFTFSSHMNPDTTLPDGTDRARRYEAYLDYCRP